MVMHAVVWLKQLRRKVVMSCLFALVSSARESSQLAERGQLACTAATCYDQRLNLDAQESQEAKEHKQQ
jgi:hypothetical protein